MISPNMLVDNLTWKEVTGPSTEKQVNTTNPWILISNHDVLI